MPPVITIYLQVFNNGMNLYFMSYSKPCVKRPLSKRLKIGFQDQLSFNAGQKYCRMLQGEHSAILLTFIKLPFVIKILVLSIFVWPFYTGFTIYHCPLTRTSDTCYSKRKLLRTLNIRVTPYLPLFCLFQKCLLFTPAALIMQINVKMPTIVLS